MMLYLCDRCTFNTVVIFCIVYSRFQQHKACLDRVVSAACLPYTRAEYEERPPVLLLL